MSAKFKKLADQIRAGWAVVGRQNNGALVMLEGGQVYSACALGCAGITQGIPLATLDEPPEGLYAQIVTNALGYEPIIRYMRSDNTVACYELNQAIYRWNDIHHLPVLKIADMVEAVEECETADELPSV